MYLLFNFFGIVVFLLSATAAEVKDLQRQEQDGKDYEQILDNLQKRLERVEKVFNISTLNPELDDMSYLEVFWEDAKRIAIKLIPPSDKECKFEIASFSCQPQCSCTFRYVLGDYSFSRACRLRESVDPECQLRLEKASSEPKKLHFFESVSSLLSFKQPATDPE